MKDTATTKVLALAAALLLSGCTASSYKEGCARFGRAGEHIVEDIPEPKTEGARMRLDAFKAAVEECKRLGRE